MRLTLRQLQIFVAVCRAGSTAGAADLIALSQSATSAALGELEAVLEAKLFDRVGKRLILNDNGRMVLPQAMQMLDAATTIEKQFAGPGVTDGPGLQIGASTTIGNYLLPSILGGYVDHGSGGYPRVLIANTSDVAQAVANFEVDIGLIEGPCHEPELQVEPWLQDELIIVCAHNHPILGNKRSNRISTKALRDAGWLLREAGSGTREAVEHALVPHLHYLRTAGEFSNAEAIKRAAVAGLGIACLSRYVVEDLLAQGRLVEMKTTLPSLRRHFYLIHSQHKILSAQLRGFLRFCREWTAKV
jgi:DNA-binding transcriptional LysR family regulator